MAIGQGFFVGNSTSRAGVLLVIVPQLIKPLRLLKGLISCVDNYISKPRRATMFITKEIMTKGCKATSKPAVEQAIKPCCWDEFSQFTHKCPRAIPALAMYKGDVSPEVAKKNRHWLLEWLTSHEEDSSVKELRKFLNTTQISLVIAIEMWGGSGRMGAPTLETRFGRFRPQCQYLWTDMERCAEKLSKLYRKARGGLPTFSEIPICFGMPQPTPQPQPAPAPKVAPAPQPVQAQPKVDNTARAAVLTDLFKSGILNAEQYAQAISKLF